MTIAKRQESPIGDYMPADEARAATDAMKGHADGFRRLAFDVHRREGWRSLGYESWSGYVAAEFGVSKSHIYRHLQAALIEAEVSPNGDVGQIAEGKLRPLAELPPGERKPVWDKAKASAGAEPTGKQVEAAVREVKPAKSKPITRPVEDKAPDFADDDFYQADPAEDAQAEAEGSAPASVPAFEPFVVPSHPATVNHPTSLIEREPGEEAEPEDEKEWLETLPLNRILANDPQKLFRADARIYRRFLATREAYRDPATSAFGNLSRKGAFGSTLARLLKANDPKHWHKCPPTVEGGCDGIGSLPGIGEKCPECYGRGYLLFAKGGR